MSGNAIPTTSHQKRKNLPTPVKKFPTRQESPCPSIWSLIPIDQRPPLQRCIICNEDTTDTLLMTKNFFHVGTPSKIL